MKSFFASETFTRIISLILAVFLWVFVVITLNPQLEITIIGVPVVYSDTEALTQNNLVIVNEQQMKVDIRLRGSRNALALVNNKNITAVVDMSGYNVVGEHYIPITIKLPVDGVSVVSKRPENVKAIIDKLITVKKPLVLNVEGVPKQGYVADSPHLAQDSVSIKGPESILKTIDKAVASIDVSNKDNDVIEMTDVTLVSVNGVPIESDVVEVTPDKVEARCFILYRKTVKVKVPLIGENAEGYTVTATTPIYNEISIVGKKEDLDAVEYIQTESVDITNITRTSEIEARLVLPQNVNTESNIEKIGVTITVDASD